MNLKKRKGSSLQIVLICFMVLSFNILFLITQIGISTSNIIINKNSDINRLLVVMTISYMKDQCKNGILLSNTYETKDYKFHYTVDDMGDYFYIDSQIKNTKQDLNFTFDLNRSDYTIKNFEYY